MIPSFHPFKWTKLRENKSLSKGIFTHLTSSIIKTNLLMKSLVIILKNKCLNLTTRTEFHHLIVNKLVKFKIKSNRQKENQLYNITSVIKESLKSSQFSKIEIIITNMLAYFKIDFHQNQRDLFDFIIFIECHQYQIWTT